MHRQYAQFQLAHGSMSPSGPTAFGSMPAFGATADPAMSTANIGQDVGGNTGELVPAPLVDSGPQGMSMPQSAGAGPVQAPPYANSLQGLGIGLKEVLFGVAVVGGIMYALSRR